MSRRVYVIQYEQVWYPDEDELSPLVEAVREGLEVLRQYAGARVVGSYEAEETEEFKDRGQDTITVPLTTKLLID